MQLFENQAECLIKEAFPDITFEEMDHWTTMKFMQYLARAEWVLVNLRGVALSQEEEEHQAPMSDMALSRQLVMQGLDPMLELYVPPEEKDYAGPQILGIEWRGLVE